MELKNHPIEKENHLNQISMTWGSKCYIYNFPGCSYQFVDLQLLDRIEMLEMLRDQKPSTYLGCFKTC